MRVTGEKNYGRGLHDVTQDIIFQIYDCWKAKCVVQLSIVNISTICLPGFTPANATVDVADRPEFLALKHERRIHGHSSNPVCGFSMMNRLSSVLFGPLITGLALP